jgi:hypothetical protein
MPHSTIHQAMLGKLDGLRTELVELAFSLDRRGSCEAADVAITLSARVRELCDEFGPTGEGSSRTFAFSKHVRSSSTRSSDQ